MPDFHVPEMHCDGCVRAVTQAVRGVDPAARVDVDLAAKRVRVGSAAPASALAAAIEDAGFGVETMPG
jgi:copper chaperone